MAVMLVTSMGELVIDLFTDQCPLATKNFLKLCKIKYYNNCLFHSVQKDFIVQTGDPTATGKGGDSVYKLLYGDQARFFDDEIHPTLKHDKVGIVAMASAGENANASQFYITTRAELDYLDEKHTVFGEVGEGLEALTRINEAFVDDNNRPYKNIRIKHTIILEDPFDDPAGLSDLIPDQSPELKPPAEGEEVRLEDDWVPMDETMDPEEIEKSIRKKEAQSRAVVLEMIGDLPEADMKPPENVLFVCKLNPVTEEGDLELIFGRFGKVKSADIIRDFKTGDSLCYAFIEFETEDACEAAYFKMDNVLIDDRRIHVDFSQSVSHLWNRYRKQGKTGGDGQSGKGCFKCGEVGHFAKECPNDGAEQKEAPTEKPKYTIKDTGGQRGHANKRYEMVFADDENPQDQRVSNKSRQGRRQEKDRDSHQGSEYHSRVEREFERPRFDRDANRRTERESDRSRVDRDAGKRTDRDRDRDRMDRDFDYKSREDRDPERRNEREYVKPRGQRDTDRRVERDTYRRVEREDRDTDRRNEREYEKPRGQRDTDRRVEREDRDTDQRNEREYEKPRGQRDTNRRVEEEYEKSRVDRDIRKRTDREFESDMDRRKESHHRGRSGSPEDLHKATGRSHDREEYGRGVRSDGRRYHKDDMRSKKRRS